MNGVLRNSNGTLKTIIAVVTTLGISTGGYVAYGKLQSDNEWTCRNLETLRIKHETDVSAIESKFGGLKAALDSIATGEAASAAKLDILVQMVRDHMQATTGGTR